MNRKDRRKAGKAARGQGQAPALPAAALSNMLLKHAGLGEPIDIEAALRGFDLAAVVKPGAAVASAFANWRSERESRESLAELEQLIARNPSNPLLHFQRGNLLRDLKRLPEAIGAYRQCLLFDPQNEHVKHLIAALGGAAAPERASDRYVASLFDSFADSFDETLVHWLDYKGPQVIVEAVRRTLDPGHGKLDILDLGCGTGLTGPLLKPWARRLDGVDLSPGMLAKAAERRIYDELAEDEICRFLGRTAQRYDLVVATDVFVYFGHLGEVLRASAAVMRPGALFAFTLEKSESAEFVLRKTGRYAHSAAHVRSQAAEAGLEVVEQSEPTVRHESKQPVPAYCFVLRQPRG